MIARLTAIYLAIFALVLAVLSASAYLFVAAQYHSLLLPALGTPEGALALDRALRRAALTIVAFDVPLLIFVGVAAWTLARLSLQPLLQARDRERAFIADAAHQLRSPLATIASVAQAHGGNSGNGTREAFGVISSTALDASALIGDMLTLAREPNAAMLLAEPVDVAAVVHTCLTEFAPRAASANIALDSTVGSAIVNGDARRLRELVRNLLENALQHARSHVAITCFSESGTAVVRVSDDGSGVEEAEREKIFERFFRGHSSGAGSGLGLAIARWTAQAHGGTLTLDDGAAGASFSARIPLLKHDA